RACSELFASTEAADISRTPEKGAGQARTSGYAPSDRFAAARLFRPVGRARGLAIGCGLHRGADLHLLVAFDRGLRRAAAVLAPDDADLGAGLRVLHVQAGEREHRALVEAVARVRRHADELA